MIPPTERAPCSANGCFILPPVRFAYCNQHRPPDGERNKCACGNGKFKGFRFCRACELAG